MSQTPPPAPVDGERDRTPELTTKRERRHREDDDGDKDRSHQRRRREGDDQDGRGGDRNKERDRDGDRERRHRHRDRDEGDDRRRRDRERRDDETEEEREERRRRRRERDRDRDRDGGDDRRGGGREHRDRDRGERRGSHHASVRDRSRESHRSHRSRDVGHEGVPSIKEMTREEKERERDRRDREMADERREAARQREERFAEMDRERERERRMRDRPPYSPPRRRPSPTYDLPPPPPREPPPPKDPVTQLLDEVDSESRSIFVSQLAARLTSSDLGLFFEDKLGRGSVRDARVVTDRVSRRSKGIGYVELDAVELVNKALALSGTVVMGIPISINLTEAERNRQGQVEAMMNGTYVPPAAPASRPAMTFGASFPPLSTGLAISKGIDVDAHADASIPYHRLFISNLSSSLAGDDIRAVFEAFGQIEFVDCHLDFSGHPKGTAYVQFKDLRSAQMALDAMAGFELAGRTIRVQTVQERSYVPEQIEETGYGPRMDATQRQQLMFKLARTEPNVNLALSAHRPAPIASKTPAMNPTPFVVVANMFNPEDETERNWDLDLAEDVKGEIETKYGKLKRIKVDKMSAGEVYLEFDQIKFGEAAIKGLNGRFFGGRQLAASFISEALFKAHL